MRELIERKKAAKKTVGNTDMRSAYYSASDGIGGVESALENEPFSKDRKLHAAFKKAQDALDEFEKLLSAGYNWD